MNRHTSGLKPGFKGVVSARIEVTTMAGEDAVEHASSARGEISLEKLYLP